MSIFLKRNCGFTLTASALSIVLVGALVLAAVKVATSISRSTKRLRTQTEVETLLESIRMIVRSPELCSKALLNGQAPARSIAKVGPGILPPYAVDAINLGLTTFAASGLPYLPPSASSPSRNVLLKEVKLETLSGPFIAAAGQTRYSANLKVKVNEMGTLASSYEKTYDFPLSVTTDDVTKNIIACGLGEVIPATPTPVVTPPPFTQSQAFRLKGTYLWQVPAGVSMIQVEAWGGGGGGGGAGCDYSTHVACGGGGGGAGGYVRATIAVTPGEVHSITVGAGGIGGVEGILRCDSSNLKGNGGAGEPGSPTVFGTYFTVTGGLGGGGCRYSPLLAGASALGGCSTPNSCLCPNCITVATFPGGDSAAGEANYDSHEFGMGGSGGNAPYGGNGAGAYTSTTPDRTSIKATAPGGGGGGGVKYNESSQNVRPGSAGAQGHVVIWW